MARKAYRCKNKSKAPDHKPILYTTLNKLLFILHALFHIVGWEQEHPTSAWCVRTSYLGSTRKNVPSELGA